MHGQHFNSSKEAVKAYKCHVSVVTLSDRAKACGILMYIWAIEISFWLEKVILKKENEFFSCK